MSRVYRAFDRKLERTVAIKLLLQSRPTDDHHLERFAREARAVAQLSHPHIVGVIDAGEDQGTPYIVLEYVAGETLKQQIAREGPLPIIEAIAYAIEIARGLRAAHAAQIVHRDIKPQNVLIDEEGSAKVTDFGIAYTPHQEGLTDVGLVVGSTDYVSPEQALGRPVSYQSDTYSLGIVIFEMLTGTLPFTGQSNVAVAMRHVRESVPDIRARRRDVSASLAATIDRMTEKDPARRHHSDDALILELEQALAVEAARCGGATGEATAVLRTLPQSTRNRVPLRLRRPFFAVGTTSLAMLGLVGLVLALVGNTQRGTGNEDMRAPNSGLHAISLGQKAARDFDPLGGDREHPEQAAFVVDRDPNTTWSTERYQGNTLNKAGVGIYVAAPKNVAAQQLALSTVTPGWSATIYGAQKGPPAKLDNGWTQLGSVRRVGRKQVFNLNTQNHKFRYYLVWITQLPPDYDQVKISEIELFK
jgi:serine/threonine-protein kinase